MGFGGSKVAPKVSLDPTVELGTLHYFDGHGRAEFLRIMLLHRKVKFKDHRISPQTWLKIKKDFPDGGLPCWQEADWKINETNAVSIYLQKRLGIRESDPKTAWEIDATFDFIYTQWGKIGPTTIAKKIDAKHTEEYMKAS